MAFNRATFRTRSLTAAVFLIIMLSGLLISHWTFFLLVTAIHFGCWIEYQKIIRKIEPDYATAPPVHRYGIMIAGWSILLYFTNNDFRFGDLSLHSIGWWLGLLFAFLLPITEMLFAQHVSLKNVGYSAAGVLYLSISLGLLIDLLRFPSIPFRATPLLPLVILASVWISDTMAYLVGSAIGRTPLSFISPKKTWEGTAGGIVLCVATVTLLCSYIMVLRDFHPLHWFMISLLAAVAGTFGDLFESKLKRMAGIKDSGSIMPGHGGFLDRFDSLLFASPVVWLYVEFFLR